VLKYKIRNSGGNSSRNQSIRRKGVIQSGVAEWNNGLSKLNTGKQCHFNLKGLTNQKSFEQSVHFIRYKKKF